MKRMVKAVRIVAVIATLTMALMACSAQTEPQQEANIEAGVSMEDVNVNSEDVNSEAVDANELEAGGDLEVGVTAPDFEIPLLSGETFKLSDNEGKVVMLNFWATWCPPCVGEMPDIQRLSEDYSEELVVVGINCGEEESIVRGYIDDEGFTYNIALDENFDMNAIYPTEAIPYTVIIDKEGIIAAIHVGAGDDMYSLFDADMERILA